MEKKQVNAINDSVVIEWEGREKKWNMVDDVVIWLVTYSEDGGWDSTTNDEDVVVWVEFVWEI